jgi:monomeric sarcosine oxidase
MRNAQAFDVAVIGAGVFGSWTAWSLNRAGAKVILLDAYGPANSRASSGGESRIIRMGYGPDEIYTRMAQRSLPIWQELSQRAAPAKLFHKTGVLWLAKNPDPYCEATLQVLKRNNIACKRLTRSQLVQRHPQLKGRSVSWGIIEPDSGVLMARQAIQSVVAEARANGVAYCQEAVVADQKNRTITQLSTVHSKTKIRAGKFVFACGPWLPKMFPALLGDLIHVTRQEVFFFGVPAGEPRFGLDQLPSWIDFNHLVYAIPDIESRGIKIAIDRHGPRFNPDDDERIVSRAGLAAVRKYLSAHMPELSGAPVIEARVCQYENTSNGDFLIDRHPAHENVWLVGGGSGHGFKHGPAVGEYVTSLMSENLNVEPRFSLVTKKRVQRRNVF